jgi:heme-degrading monooxygenase HmoA
VIVRTWRGRVPAAHAEGFLAHLLATGVADYAKQPGCREVRVWRADDGEDVVCFTLISIWSSMDAVRAYAGSVPHVAVLYPEDERFELVPDRTVEHHALAFANPEVGA